MKIVITTDLEGVTGVVDDRQLSDVANPFYRQARAQLMKEVNAAIIGAKEAGATEFIVLDGHGSGFDMALDLDLIEDQNVQFLLGTGGDSFDAIDDSVKAFFMVGQHPKKGPTGCLEHSWADRVFMCTKLCGVEIGEIGLWAAAMGERNIPLALIAGDEQASKEMANLAKNVVGVAVKKAFGRSKALNLHPQKAQELIRRGAAQAIKNLSSISCWKPQPPFVLDLEYSSAAMVAKCRLLDFVKQTGDNALQIHGQTLAEILRRFYFLNRIV
jgi:D-amino peptidase